MKIFPFGGVVRSLVYAGAVLVPLFYLPWGSNALEIHKQLLLIVLSSVGLIVWLLKIVVSGKLTLRRSPLDLGIAAMVAATVAATAFSIAKVTSVFGTSASLSSSLLTVLALAIFYFLAVQDAQEHGRTLQGALTISLALALAVGICQMLGWYVLPGALTHARIFNTIGTVNMLGILAAVALPLFAKCGAPFGRLGVIFSTAGTLLSLLVLTLLNWWVLWVVALVGMLAMIAFDVLSETPQGVAGDGSTGRYAMQRFVVPAVVIVLGAFLLLIHFSPEGLRSQIPVEISPSQRLSSGVAKGVLSDRPVLGYGPENFSLAFDRYGASAVAETQMASWKFYDGASEAFNTVTGLGILGILALAVVLWGLVCVFRKSGRVTSARTSAAFSSLLAMVAAFFLYPFSLTLAFTSVVLLALAALADDGGNAMTLDFQERPTRLLVAYAAFVTLLIVLLCGVYFVSARYVADARYARGLQEQSAQTALDDLTGATDLWPSDARVLRDSSQLVLVLLREVVSAGPDNAERQKRVQELMSSAIAFAQRAGQVAPRDAVNWENLGSVYKSMTGMLENSEQLSEDAFKKAAELRPGDPSFDYQIGSLWYARANILQRLTKTPTAQRSEQISASLSRAEDAFKRAIVLSPSYGLAIYNLGAVYDQQGRIAEAIHQLELVTAYNSEQPTLLFELGMLYIRAGKKENATAAMRQAVTVAPQYSNARWYLALLLEEAGDWDGALKQLLEIEKSNPDDESLKAKIAQVRTKKSSKTPIIDNAPIE